MGLYRAFVPKQAVGANLVYFDIFVPTTSTQRVELVSCLPVVSGAVAVTGVVGVDLILTRTSAAGTGGTAATFSGTDTTAMTISAHDNSARLTLNEIAGMLTPSGGATAGAVLSWCSVFTEETNGGTYTIPLDLATGGVAGLDNIVLAPGTGFRVVQGAVASVGNIGFNVILKTNQR